MLKLIIKLMIAMLLIQNIFLIKVFADENDFRENLKSKVRLAKMLTEYDEDATIDQCDTVYFGNYNGYGTNEWFILEKDNNKVLLLSKNIFRYIEYNSKGGREPYKNSSICTYANSNFYNETFSKEERKLISVVNGEKVFLLNEELINKYFTINGKVDNKKLKSFYFNENYKYVEYNHLKEKDEESAWNKYDIKNCYWISDKGKNDYVAKFIDADGNVDNFGDMLDRALGFRPLIWIDFDKVSKEESIENQIKNAKTYYDYGSDADIDTFDTVFFGSYEQDSNFENGKEPIEWIVVDRKEGEAKLLSKYVLDVKPYYLNNQKGSYKKSYLRYWMNTVFYNVAFDKNEKNKILYKEFESKSKKDVYDYVLPYGDIKNENRSEGYGKLDARMTDYVLHMNVNHIKEQKNDNYRLENDYYINDNYISESRINQSGINAQGVRPCIWLKVDGISEVIKTDKKNGYDYDKEVENYYNILSRRDSKKAYSLSEIEKAKRVSEYDNKSNVEQFDTVLFGEYEQDNNIENGKEAIEWLVLDRDEESALLLSKYILDNASYHTNKEMVGWDKSAIRLWCNSYFINEAFGDYKDYILESRIKNLTSAKTQERFSNYKNIRVPDTNDKVYLMSMDEARFYFGYDTNELIDNVKLATTQTDFAKSTHTEWKENYITWYDENQHYWLRTIGEGTTIDGGNTVYESNLIATIDMNGSINYHGRDYYASSEYIGIDEVDDAERFHSSLFTRGIRPMIRIDLKQKNRFDSIVTKKRYVKNYNKIQDPPVQYNIDKVENARTILDFDDRTTISFLDTVVFGNYEQDNNTKNGKEKIEWLVLDKDDENILLLSKKILDHKSYNEEKINDLKYEDSSIFKWLNEEFINEAFTEEEKEKLNILRNKSISIATISEVEKNYGKVFLPSSDDILKYFSIKDRRAVATDYALNVDNKDSKLTIESSYYYRDFPDPDDDKRDYWTRTEYYYIKKYVTDEGNYTNSMAYRVRYNNDFLDPKYRSNDVNIAKRVEATRVGIRPAILIKRVKKD